MEISEGLKKANPVKRIVLTWTSSLTRIFILHQNIHVKRVVTLSTKELGTLSKNSLCLREGDHLLLPESYYLVDVADMEILTLLL